MTNYTVAEIERLLRKFKNVRQLAEELYTMMTQFEAGTGSTETASSTGLPEGQTYLHPDYSDLEDLPDIARSPIELPEFEDTVTPEFLPEPMMVEREDGTAKQLPPATIGQIVSQLEDGEYNEYLVTIYPDGPEGESFTIIAKQLQIAEDEVIPTDTWVLLVRAGENWYMQAPVWLEAPEEEE